MGKPKKRNQKTNLTKIKIGIASVLIILLASFLYWHYSLKPPTLLSPPLKDLAKANNIELGIHLIPRDLDLKIYTDIVSSQFGFVTIDGGGSHFNEIQPEPNKYNFVGADKMVQFAEAHNMPVQFHHLVWGDAFVLPKWLKNGHYSKEELTNILHDHVTAIVSRYKGRVKEYSAVNEAFAEHQHSYGLKNWWADHLGNDYINQVFIWAHQIDPNAKLLVNDFNNETETAVSDDIYNYIKSAKANGVPVDGVGMQLHVNAANPPNKDQMIANMKRFGALGVPVYVTEFDINTNRVKGSGLFKQQLESKITKDVVGACIESKACISFDVFGLTSKNDIVKTLTRTNSRAYMFDSRFRPRLSYYAFRDAWEAN